MKMLEGAMGLNPALAKAGGLSPVGANIFAFELTGQSVLLG